jgi:hypothetical protein
LDSQVKDRNVVGFWINQAHLRYELCQWSYSPILGHYTRAVVDKSELVYSTRMPKVTGSSCCSEMMMVGVCVIARKLEDRDPSQRCATVGTFVGYHARTYHFHTLSLSSLDYHDLTTSSSNVTLKHHKSKFKFLCSNLYSRTMSRSTSVKK